MSEKTIGFIGGGRITRILLGGWAKAGKLPSEIAVSDPDAESLSRLSGEFPSVQTAGGDNTLPVVHRPPRRLRRRPWILRPRLQKARCGRRTKSRKLRPLTRQP